MIPWNTCRSIAQLMDWTLAHHSCGQTGEKDTETTQFSLKNTNQTHKTYSLRATRRDKLKDHK